MKKRCNWLLVPSILLPYILLATLAFIYLGPTVPVLDYIWTNLFFDNIFVLAAWLVAYVFVAFGLTIIYFIISMKKKQEPLALAKTAAVIKLVQIPAFIVLFVLGLLMLITVFTLPFVVVFVIFDFLTIVLSGMVVIAAVVNAYRKKTLSIGVGIVFILCQLVFVADIVTAIVLWGTLRKEKKYEP